MRSRGARVAVGLAAVLGLTHCGGIEAVDEPELAQQESAVASSATFGAVADARVEAGAPTTNFGTSGFLRADLSPESQSHLRFSVTGVSGTVTRATLRLWVTDGSADGPRLFTTAGGWTETALTWNTRPATSGAALGDKGAVSSGTWMEYDVTPAVRGNGEVNFALVATGADGVDVASRQAATTAQRPQLVVVSDTAAPPPPPPTASCGETITQQLESAVRDGTVAQEQPDTDFSGLDSLVVDASPRSEAYLGFRLDEDFPHQGPEPFIVRAVLRLYAFDGSVDGPALYLANFDTSGDLTWNTRTPPTGAPIADKGVIAANTWVEYDVTETLRANAFIGVQFALLTSSADATRFFSTEAANTALRPQLVITRSTGCSYTGTGGALAGFRQYGSASHERVVDSAGDRQGGTVVLATAKAGATFGGASLASDQDLVLARYDAAGAHLWSRGYWTPSAQSPMAPSAVALSPEGFIVVAGTYSGTPNLGTGPLPAASGGMFIAKFSPDGRPMWSQGFQAHVTRLGAPEPRPLIARDVVSDANGSLIVVASAYGHADLGGGELQGGDSANVDTPGLMLAKYRYDGVHLWSRSIPPGQCPQPVYGYAVATDASGAVLVGGRACYDVLGGGTGETPFVMRYSSTGERQWVRRIDGVFGEVLDVAAGPNGTVHFAGHFKGRFTFAGREVRNRDPEATYAGTQDLMVGTWRADGSEAWLRDLPGANGHAFASRLAVDSAGRVAVMGLQSQDDLGGGRMEFGLFLARYGTAGEHLWSRSFGPDYSGGYRYGLSVQPSGHVVMGYTLNDPIRVDGRTFSSRGSGDVLLLQFAP